MSEKQEKNWEFQISQYLDGLLGEADSAELQAKLKSDPELQELFDQYQTLQCDLETLADDLPEMNFDLQRQQIMEQVALRKAPGVVSLRRRVLRPVFTITAVAAAVLIAFGMYMFVSSHIPTAPEGKAQSVALRPSPVQTGEVLATVTPASPEMTTKGIVQILAKRMDVKPQPAPEKPSAGTVMVSVGSPDMEDMNYDDEDEIDNADLDVAEEYWF